MDPNMQAQPGGAPGAGGAPQSGGAPQGGDPAAQLPQMVQQYAQSKDPQLGQQILDILVQAMAPGGGAPGGDAAAGGAPAGGAPGAEGAPSMMRKGGRIPFKSMKGKEADTKKTAKAGARPKLSLPK